MSVSAAREVASASGLDVIEVRIDACHPFSQVHLAIPYYTIRSFLSVSTSQSTGEQTAHAERAQQAASGGWRPD